MKQKSLAGLFISLFLLIAACNKSDDKPNNTADPQPNLSPQFSCEMDGQLFQPTSIFSRFQSDGRLAISATDSLGSTLYVSMKNFVGNGIYLTGTWSDINGEEPIVKYTKVLNEDTTYYVSKPTYDPMDGIIDVNTYTESPNVVGGIFNLTLLEFGNVENQIEVENGIFSDLLILPKLTTSDPGVFSFWWNGKFYRSVVTEAILFEDLFLSIAFEIEDEPLERFRYYLSLDPNNPRNFLSYDWYPETQNEETFDFFIACNGARLTHPISINNGKLTGGSGSLSKDLEIYFKDIPVTQVPINDISNQLSVNTPNGVIDFQEIQLFEYDYSGDSDKLTIKATNDLGQILNVFRFNPFPWNFDACDENIETWFSISDTDGSTIFSNVVRSQTRRDQNTELASIAGDSYRFMS